MAMLPPLAETNDLAAWLGVTFTTEQEPRAQAVLVQASALVRAEAGQTWYDTETEQIANVPDDVSVVVIQAAARAWRNPEGYASETGDDYTYRLGQAQVTGIYLTEDERRILSRYRGTSKLWTQPTTRGEWLGDTVYVPVDYDGEPVPFYTGEFYYGTAP